MGDIFMDIDKPTIETFFDVHNDTFEGFFIDKAADAVELYGADLDATEWFQEVLDAFDELVETYTLSLNEENVLRAHVTFLYISLIFTLAHFNRDTLPAPEGAIEEFEWMLEEAAEMYEGPALGSRTEEMKEAFNRVHMNVVGVIDYEPSLDDLVSA